MGNPRSSFHFCNDGVDGDKHRNDNVLDDEAATDDPHFCHEFSCVCWVIRSIQVVLKCLLQFLTDPVLKSEY